MIDKKELLDIDGVTPEMIEMYEQAVERGFMFYARTMQLWFFPDQLVAFWKDKRYRWKPEHWELRHPQNAIYELNGKIGDLHDRIGDITRQRTAIVEYITKK